MADPRLVAILRPAVEALVGSHLDVARRVNKAVDADGKVRGSQIVEVVPQSALPALLAAQIALDGFDFDDIQAFIDALVTTYAPIGSKYIVQTADATLTAEQALSALATGLLKVATTTGVLSTAVANTDYLPVASPTATGTLTTANLTATGDSTLGNATNDLLTVTGRIRSAGASPTIAAGAAAGTTPTISIVGTDRAGMISLTTGTSPLTGTLWTVTFNAARGDANYTIGVWPAEADAVTTGAIRVNAISSGRTTTDWTAEAAGTALTASTAYRWYYQCEEYEL